MLRELNDKHLKIISEKQSDIECLQQKLETLEQFRLEQRSPFISEFVSLLLMSGLLVLRRRGGNLRSQSASWRVRYMTWKLREMI